MYQLDLRVEKKLLFYPIALKNPLNLCQRVTNGFKSVEMKLKRCERRQAKKNIWGLFSTY
jgi:hypothetical protein